MNTCPQCRDALMRMIGKWGVCPRCGRVDFVAFRDAFSPQRDRSEYLSFLSYSTRDDEVNAIKPFIDRYVDALRAHVEYIPLYYDRFYLPGGHPNLCAELAGAIRRSDFTTCFQSPGYDSSPWCGFEWGCTYALNAEAVRPPALPSHPALAIVWKRPIENFVARASFARVVDISDAIAAGDADTALRAAVTATCSLLDDLFSSSARSGS